MDGQYILAGASNKTTPAGVGTGKVCGFAPVNGVWTQVAQLTPNNAVANGRFGGSVGTCGQNQRAFIGAWDVNGGDGEGTSSGAT